MSKIDMPYPDQTFYNMYAFDCIKAQYIKQTIEKILELGGIESAYDLGCGPGLTMKAFREAGVFAIGFDNNKKELCSCAITPANIIYRDLRKPLYDDYVAADLVYSVEVAEHIEIPYVDVFFDNVVKLSNKWIFLTGSNKKHSPGHVNPQPNEYWQEKVEERGEHVYREDLSLEMRRYFRDLIGRPSRLRWFQENVLMFERKGLNNDSRQMD